MKLLKNILVAIDFSESTENELNNAIQFAKMFNSKITLIHVLPDDIDNEKVKTLVNKAATSQLKEINNKIISEEIETGDPILEHGRYSDCIVNASDRINANLVIVGAGKKLEKDKFQLGITAENIIRKSDKPVFVIKNSQPLNINKIICPIDFSQESSRALNNAIIMARMFKAKLVVLSVYPLFRQTFTKLDASKINEQRRKDHEIEFHEFKKPFNFVDGNFDMVIKGGDPALEILKSIKETKADLVIMGTTGRSGINKVLMGSVTEKVVREMLCSFITLKKADVITLEIDSKIQDIENHYATAEKLFEKGFFDESLNQYKICLDINYTHIPSLKGIVKVYKKLGDNEKARKYQETVKNILDQIWNMKIEKEVRSQRKH